MFHLSRNHHEAYALKYITSNNFHLQLAVYISTSELEAFNAFFYFALRRGYTEHSKSSPCRSFQVRSGSCLHKRLLGLIMSME